MENYYFNFCKKFKSLMKLAKANNKPEILKSNNETLYVEYCDEFNDYILQYTWVLDNMVTPLSDELVELINNYESASYSEKEAREKMDILQIGMVTSYCSNEEIIASTIEHLKSYSVKSIRDTYYLFGGKKILRIVQYNTAVRCPVNSLINTHSMHDTQAETYIKDKNLKVVTTGIKYYYPLDNPDLVFVLETKENNTVITTNLNKYYPDLLCLDNFLGLIEENLKNTNN